MLDSVGTSIPPPCQETRTSGADRRSDPRQPALTRASIEMGRDVVDCVILDVSASGVRVRIDEDQPAMAASVGQQMILCPLGGEPVAVSLRWVNGRGLGLQFLSSVEPWALSLTGDKARRMLRPRSGRAEVSIPTAINAGGRQFQGCILNLSVGGALIRTSADLQFGEQIILETDIVRPIGAYVRWRKRDMIGVMFGRLLPVDSAKIIAGKFAVHSAWMREVIRCHEGSLDWSLSSETDQKTWWGMAGK